MSSETERIADDAVPDPTRLKPDTLFGHTLTDRFQLSDRVLGSGSFGHAFLCFDYGNADLDPEASKVPTCIAKIETTPTQSCLRADETQLEHEFHTYTHLWKHPKMRRHIPEVHLFMHHQIGPERSVPVMVMERVGRDLLTILETHDLPYYQLRTLGAIGLQVVGALKYMHEMFIVHRDIKPQNIMLIVDGPTFHVKLIDFGLSMPIPANDLKDRDAYRSSTCTLAFASWRQHFRHVCSARTDMESFLYSWSFLAGTPIPWRNAPSEADLEKTARREYIGHMKRQTRPSELGFVFDEGGADPYGTTFGGLLDHILGLTFDEKPAYSKFYMYFKWLSLPPRRK